MLNDLYFDIGFIMFLNYNRIDLIKVTIDFIDLISGLN